MHITHPLSGREQRLLMAIDGAGLSRERATELVRTVNAGIRDADQAKTELECLVGEAREYLLSNGRGGDLDAFTAGVIEAARARSTFAGSADVIEDGLRHIERHREADPGQSARMDPSEMALLAEGIRLGRLVLRAQSVAAKEARLVALTTSPDARFRALTARQDAYLARGRDTGVWIDLEIAIALAHAALAQAADADQRGAALTLLGTALSTLGERESGTERLREAVAAFRAALEEYTRERVPLDWAMTQARLGNVLRALGQRERETAPLEQAVAAFRAALEEGTRERVPLGWAGTQNNLGAALATLGQRGSGTRLLNEAVAAFRAALEERTRERAPLGWAVTQANLAGVLGVLAGKGDSPLENLAEALRRTELALEVYRSAGASRYVRMAEKNAGLFRCGLAALDDVD